MEKVTFAVIGGSGLYNMPEISDKTHVSVDTPFGLPSSDIMIGTLRGKRVAFLPRHGNGHVFTPTTVPYQANIFALKTLGVRHIIAVNACGSLREDYAPGHIVIPDQLYDHTKSERGRTFFTNGLVGHISVAEPFCEDLGDVIETATREVGGMVHRGGALIVVEGPRFSTRGESNVYRQWGCSIIGMTTAPEAFLAREAEICYSTMAHVTDYDVWHQSEEPVTVEKVMETMQHNLDVAQKAVALVIERMSENHTCACHTALDNAIMTDPNKIPAQLRADLRPILERVLPDNPTHGN
jgi:5'-methylthioadenosine phosphorylase